MELLPCTHFVYSCGFGFAFLFGMRPGYYPVLSWSFTILASFWGYGEALRRLLNREEFDESDYHSAESAEGVMQGGRTPGRDRNLLRCVFCRNLKRDADWE